MARMVMHRTPVVVRHPVTNQYVGMYRGKELPDSDPICRDPQYAWLFRDTPEPIELKAVRLNDIEAASAAPGEMRGTRRR